MIYLLGIVIDTRNKFESFYMITRLPSSFKYGELKNPKPLLTSTPLQIAMDFCDFR